MMQVRETDNKTHTQENDRSDERKWQHTLCFGDSPGDLLYPPRALESGLAKPPPPKSLALVA